MNHTVCSGMPPKVGRRERAQPQKKTCEQHAAAHGQTQGNRPYLGHQHPSEDQTAQTDTQPQQRNAALGLHRIAETQLCGGTSHVLRQPDQFDPVAGIEFGSAPHGDLHTRPHDGPDIDPVHEFSRQDLSDPLPGSPLAIDHDRKDLNGKIRQCRIGHFGTDPLLFADDVFAATADDQLIARTDHCPGCHLIDDLPLLAEPFDENTLSVALHDGFEFVDGTPALEPFVIGAENPENDLPGRRVEAGFQADVFAHLLLQIARRLLHLRHAAQQPGSIELNTHAEPAVPKM